MNGVPAITVTDLQRSLSGAEPMLLLDVREKEEVHKANIAGALNIPMRSVPASLDRLTRDRRIAVLCHHGVRSAMVAGFLLRQGYDAVNVDGGIDAWSREVDPSVARY